MRSLILESNSGIEQTIRVFIPFGLLEEILVSGFPEMLIQAIVNGKIKDGSHILNVKDEVRLTISVNTLQNIRGPQSIQAITFIEISENIVQRKEDVEKIHNLAKDLERIFPSIKLAVVQKWNREIEKKEIPQEASGVFLPKDKWYLSDENVNILKKIEGRPRNKPFWDVRHWAIGYGHMLNSQFQLGQEISDEKIEELFVADKKRFEKTVRDFINVPLTLDMYAALVSFAYNCGSGGFRGSKTAELINQKKYNEAAEVLKTEKIKLGTKYEKGLRRRRQKESDLFLGKLSKNSI
jgi:lysozyme